MLLDPDGKREGLRDKTILVTGGDGDKVRKVAESYGFRNVVTPADIYTAQPEIWPFAKNFASYYASHSRPLPAPIYLGPSNTSRPLSEHLKIGAIFIYNDPRDWGLDATIILDLLLSHAGYLGTISGLNGKKGLPNRGYQQDGQPVLWYSNPDLWWAASWHINRLGQGGFREALEGLWRATADGAKMKKEICGKPTQATYEFAEKRLIAGRQKLLGADAGGPQRVYMVGDNPASDITGANLFQSPTGARWKSILVRSGVYSGGKPAVEPNVIVDDVWDALRWAGEHEGWEVD
ncbi:MAG: hypothetical protein MMC23_004309 [Stictis urceolatum]|nr:hypothetical protein [Stictis urceolata]